MESQMYSFTNGTGKRESGPARKILHDRNRKKFFTVIENRESMLSYERLNGTIELKHTMVAEDDRGEGIAEELVLTAFEYADAHDLKVVPSCSYVEKYLNDHPRWEYLSGQKTLWQRMAEYWPVVLLVSVSLWLAVTLSAAGDASFRSGMHYFMGTFLVGFSFFKLLDLRGFKKNYQEYDVIAEKMPAYGYVYPFIELLLGTVLLAFIMPALTYFCTALVMGVSSLGPIRAVREGRDLNCACMGTVISLPMSSVAIFEDVTMALAAVGMLVLSVL